MGHPYGSAPDRLTVAMVLPPRRIVRASVSAAAAVALGLTGHLLAGGRPTLVGGMLAFLAVLTPSWLLAGRERGWTVIAGVQVGAQQVVHPLLVAASGLPEPGALPHDLMFFLHLAGALAMATWLRMGERRMWAIARRFAAHLVLWASRLVRGPLPVTEPVARPRPLMYVPLPACVVRCQGVSRRGPPLPA